jgi:hypothetical protein
MLPAKRPFRFTVTNNIKCEHHTQVSSAGSRPSELLDRFITIKVYICACRRAAAFVLSSGARASRTISPSLRRGSTPAARLASHDARRGSLIAHQTAATKAFEFSNAEL